MSQDPFIGTSEFTIRSPRYPRVVSQVKYLADRKHVKTPESPRKQQLMRTQSVFTSLLETDETCESSKSVIPGQTSAPVLRQSKKNINRTRGILTGYFSKPNLQKLAQRLQVLAVKQISNDTPVENTTNDVPVINRTNDGAVTKEALFPAMLRPVQQKVSHTSETVTGQQSISKPRSQASINKSLKKEFLEMGDVSRYQLPVPTLVSENKCVKRRTSRSAYTMSFPVTVDKASCEQSSTVEKKLEVTERKPCWTEKTMFKDLPRKSPEVGTIVGPLPQILKKSQSNLSDFSAQTTKKVGVKKNYSLRKNKNTGKTEEEKILAPSEEFRIKRKIKKVLKANIGQCSNNEKSVEEGHVNDQTSVIRPKTPDLTSSIMAWSPTKGRYAISQICKTPPNTPADPEENADEAGEVMAYNSRVNTSRNAKNEEGNIKPYQSLVKDSTSNRKQIMKRFKKPSDTPGDPEERSGRKSRDKTEAVGVSDNSGLQGQLEVNCLQRMGRNSRADIRRHNKKEDGQGQKGYLSLVKDCPSDRIPMSQKFKEPPDTPADPEKHVHWNNTVQVQFVRSTDNSKGYQDFLKMNVLQREAHHSQMNTNTHNETQKSNLKSNLNLRNDSSSARKPMSQKCKAPQNTPTTACKSSLPDNEDEMKSVEEVGKSGVYHEQPETEISQQRTSGSHFQRCSRKSGAIKSYRGLVKHKTPVRRPPRPELVKFIMAWSPTRGRYPIKNEYKSPKK